MVPSQAAMEDDDMDNNMEPALFTKPLPNDYKPGTSPPVDGVEYLKRVQYETRMTPAVPTPPEKLFRRIRIDDGASASYLPLIANKVAPGNETFLPSIEWQNQQVADFSDVRRIIAIRRESKEEEENPRKEVVIPEHYSAQAWFKICISDPNKPERVQSNGIKLKTSLEPSVSLLLKLSQDTLECLLGHFVEWIKEGNTTVQLSGKWIYSIFACLEIPLLPEMCASLRELCRLAAEERSKLTVNEGGNVNTLNLIICLVGRYFSQHDLAD